MWANAAAGLRQKVDRSCDALPLMAADLCTKTCHATSQTLFIFIFTRSLLSQVTITYVLSLNIPYARISACSSCVCVFASLKHSQQCLACDCGNRGELRHLQAKKLNGSIVEQVRLDWTLRDKNAEQVRRWRNVTASRRHAGRG